LQRQDLLEFAKVELMVKASITDRTNQEDVKRINDTQEVVSKLMFPENFAKTVLPSVELKTKADKFNKISKKFPVNYKKVNGRPRR
jgi:hypothetical protein